MKTLKKLSQRFAERKISDFILKKQSEGVTQLSAFDIVVNLKIPAPQVDSIMDKFKKERNLKEINA